MKKIFNVKLMLIIFLIIIFTGVLLPTRVKAESELFSNSYIQPSKFEGKDGLEKFQLPNNKTIGGLIRDFISIILSIARTISLAWGIIMAIAIAIKYMTGSPKVKSQLKTDMPTYIVGAVLLFGAAGIMTFLKYFVDDVLPTT